jgi:putative ABC transport system ATP-binding protein
LGVEGVPALRGVSLTIKRGEFVVIFGLSGGGKTTLLNIIGTIDKPTKGELYLSGHRIDSTTTDDTLSFLRLQKLGFVFQTFNLLSSLTALENVEMPMILAGEKNVRERRKRAKDLLSRVGMGPRLNHIPAQLSGGEQQRVTIARAIANHPEILLLDEPTGDLDSINTCIVLQQLLKLNTEENITLVMVTHDVGLKNFANRVIWMRDGKIQNVEKISEKRRLQRREELHREYEELVKGTKQKHTPYQNTVIRSPQDYTTHPKYEARDPIYYNFSETYQRMQEMTLEEYEDQAFPKSKNSASNPQLIINEETKEDENGEVVSLLDSVTVN